MNEKVTSRRDVVGIIMGIVREIITIASLSPHLPGEGC